MCHMMIFFTTLIFAKISFVSSLQKILYTHKFRANFGKNQGCEKYHHMTHKRSLKTFASTFAFAIVFALAAAFAASEQFFWRV